MMAVGMIAVGVMAVGVMAVGVMAVGVMAVGVIAVGVIAVGVMVSIVSPSSGRGHPNTAFSAGTFNEVNAGHDVGQHRRF